MGDPGHHDLVEIATAGGSGDASVVSRLPADGFRFSSAMEGFATSRAASAAEVPQPGSPLPSVGISVGPFALRARSRVLAEAAMSRELADLTVNGFNPERIQEYAVRGTSFRVASFSEVTASWGHRVGDLIAFGVGLRMVQGHTLSQGRFFEPEVDLDDESLRVTGVSVEAPGGSGYGVDMGLAVDLGGGVRVSLAGSNVIQKMTWEEALVAHEATFTDTDFDEADFADLIDRFEERAIDPTSASLEVYEAARGLFDDSFFPARSGRGWRSRSPPRRTTPRGPGRSGVGGRRAAPCTTRTGRGRTPSSGR